MNQLSERKRTQIIIMKQVFTWKVTESIHIQQFDIHMLVGTLYLQIKTTKTDILVHQP